MPNDNKRIYYAIQQVRLGDVNGGTAQQVHGLQTVGVQTSFNLEQVFEMGQLEIYQNMEEVPDVEVTLNKVLDGYPTLYTLATETGADNISNSVATNPTLTGRQNARVDVELAIFPDNLTASQGDSLDTPYSVVKCPGMYVSSVSYTFPVDGNFTEDVTLVGNNKTWVAQQASVGQFDVANPDVPAAESINRRQHLNMDVSRFPNEIPGVGSVISGKVEDYSNAGKGYSTHFQNITVSCDLGRESINELGRFAPYYRYVSFPVEVTAEFEVLATEGDGIQAAEEGFYKKVGGNDVEVDGTEDFCTHKYNLRDQLIYIETCEGTKIYLGAKNKLSSVNYSGGDTGGGNVTVSYSYSTFNDFVVAHTSMGFAADVGSTGYTGVL